jgi:hypothetical protein
MHRFPFPTKVRFSLSLFVTACIATALTDARAFAANDERALAQFKQSIAPLLQARCYDCHGDGAKKGGLAFDELTSKEQIVRHPELWLKVLRNTRSHIMPPPGETPLTAAEQRTLEQWIVAGAFGLDPAQPDPGRVTLRRLNRTEYRNTLRDLIGVDFNAEALLPPDDVGYGFDNIGDVMSISPMRMEKFLDAAMAAVNQGVPLDTFVMSSRMTIGDEFKTADGTQNAARMSYYQPRRASYKYQIKKAGDYRIILNTKIDGEAMPVDPQRAKVSWTADGTQILGSVYKWADADYLTDERTVRWEPGEHEVAVSIEPVDPELQPLRTKMEYRVLWVTLEGPLAREQWEHHPNYKRFYTRERPPEAPAERRAYAHEVLARFIDKAYRRPVETEKVDQLVKLAEFTYSIPGNTFEKGIAQAIAAVLASPRFLFHLERTEPVNPGQRFPQIDEYSLASRLSYALWSSMPDDELIQLAARGALRANFRAQAKRMLADPRAKAMSENFAGQWLQSRGVLDVPINSEVVMAAEALPTPPGATPPPSNSPPVNLPVVAGSAPGAPPGSAVPASGNTPPAGAAIAGGPPGFGARGGRGPGAAGAPGAPGNLPGRGFGGFGRRRPPPGTVLTIEIREAMKAEAEAYFHHIVSHDRSVLELLDSNYTFANDQLAPVYGIPDIKGAALRHVELPADSVRGGVLTMGSVLTVTSNPTRTSPVKRGKWILENILGAPPAPPPPDIPALEDAKPKGADKNLTQRDLLALHRADPICASCHERMDPLGLAMEGFNAFGRARTHEAGQPIDPSGELTTGEKFSGVRDLKRALLEKHRIEFYRTLTEKMLTYVLGRGVEYYDVPTIDAIVEQLDRDNGRFSTLLLGILESAPFQQRRVTAHASYDPKVVALPTSANSAP